MSHPVQLQCANPECLHPDNASGQAVCNRCQTPLVYRYLWAVGAASAPLDTLVSQRYWVTQPQIWLDTKPGTVVGLPVLMPEAVLPYLHLYLHRLHLPGLYGFCSLEEGALPILLLDNVPIDANGQLFPLLEAAWATAAPARQVYWLWQLWQLWLPLKAQRMATSLLTPENLHVEGWRVRLRELIADVNPQADEETSGSLEEGTSTASLPAYQISPPFLKDLAAVWQPWVERSDRSIATPLKAIYQQMQTGEDSEAITAQLNQLLLTQTAQLPLALEIAGATTTGTQRAHNEDACFPLTAAGNPPETSSNEPLLPHVGIICDGIGGHEGGEVASQLALKTLQLQLRVLFSEISNPELEPREPLSPIVVKQQLQEVVRVVNNLISDQNDSQGRELRQRMGTTLVMAVQLPQSIATPPVSLETPSDIPIHRPSHELYLVHVGDSRAYWLTPDYCHALTVDDDVVTREVMMGHSSYQEAIRRPDGGALIQALGTRDADLLDINVQRFLIEEDGLLLLCSDGLSDYDRIEQFWQPITQSVFAGERSLLEAVQAWIDLANQKNGHDNTSVVLLRCQVGNRFQRLKSPAPASLSLSPTIPPREPELAASSKALLYDEEHPDPPSQPHSADRRQRLSPTVKLLGIALLVLTLGLVGTAMWQWSQGRSTIPAGSPSDASSGQPATP
ncbi:serine/threonine-protein phosphatase [Phormidium tenue FACHB-886]|nr:serine/threonine-protein phosphatase [Phormidium tenue FACHB-886]